VQALPVLLIPLLNSSVCLCLFTFLVGLFGVSLSSVEWEQCFLLRSLEEVLQVLRQ